MKAKVTIYDIKERTKESSPFFFTRDTLKFFHQKMSDFKIKKQPDGRYLICAPMKDHSGRIVGQTKRYFNPDTNKLEFVED
jgi:hypothetical protein